jgi:hypothetical protein
MILQNCSIFLHHDVQLVVFCVENVQKVKI